jgi:uncharacterized protein with HEPN domain
MPRRTSGGQAAHLYDMLESGRLIRRYLSGVSFEGFWGSGEKRDAVAMRIVTIGDAARHITPSTQAAIPGVPFRNLRGMRDRLTHENGKVDFREVWAVAERDIAPVIEALEAYFAERGASGA